VRRSCSPQKGVGGKTGRWKRKRKRPLGGGGDGDVTRDCFRDQKKRGRSHKNGHKVWVSEKVERKPCKIEKKGKAEKEDEILRISKGGGGGGYFRRNKKIARLIGGGGEKGDLWRKEC